jgi:hypothetical protein
MHNAEAERIRDLVLLWHMVFGRDWVSGSRADIDKMLWDKLKTMVDTLGEHKYLEFKAEEGRKSHARLNNKALKHIGAQQHDTKD